MSTADDPRRARHASTSPRGRVAALEGVRGAAIVLVVVSHIWILVPVESALEGPARGVLKSGNLAVTVFFVLGGFFLVRSLQRDVEVTGRVDVQQALLARWARLSVQVYPLVVVMLAVASLAPAGTYDQYDNPRSAFRLVTYTWNWFAMSDVFASRPDVGHLWFVSVYLQVALGLVLLVALVRGRRVVLSLLLLGAVVATVAWRWWSVENEDIFVTLLRTTTRMDGMLWGALLAATRPWLRRPGRRASVLAALLGVVTLGALVAVAEDESYFRWAGTAAAVATCVLLVALQDGQGGVVSRVLAFRPLSVLGRYSFAAYVWHFAIFWWVSKEVPEWSEGPKVGLAVAATAVVVVLTHHLMERPLGRWLDARRDERLARPLRSERERVGLMEP